MFLNRLAHRLVVAVVLLFASATFADPTWVGGSGNWSVPAHWKSGVLPVINHQGFIITIH